MRPMHAAPILCAARCGAHLAHSTHSAHLAQHHPSLTLGDEFTCPGQRRRTWRAGRVQVACRSRAKGESLDIWGAVQVWERVNLGPTAPVGRRKIPCFQAVGRGQRGKFSSGPRPTGAGGRLRRSGALRAPGPLANRCATSRGRVRARLLVPFDYKCSFDFLHGTTHRKGA